MNEDLRGRLEAFLRPLHQDVDGTSRTVDVERIAAMARRIHAPAPGDERAFELLLMFHRLGKWLDRVGNISRTVLAVGGIEESELRRTAASIRRLDAPQTDAERAVAAAILIDASGLRGLTEHFASARREGNSLMDVIRAAVSDTLVPDWFPEAARPWLQARRDSRRDVCRMLLEELTLEDSFALDDVREELPLHSS